MGDDYKKWEYYVWLPYDLDRFLDVIEDLGQSGWELVLRYDDKFIFKRQIFEED